MAHAHLIRAPRWACAASSLAHSHNVSPSPFPCCETRSSDIYYWLGYPSANQGLPCLLTKQVLAERCRRHLEVCRKPGASCLPLQHAQKENAIGQHPSPALKEQPAAIKAQAGAAWDHTRCCSELLVWAESIQQAGEGQCLPGNNVGLKFNKSLCNLIERQ